MKILAAVCPSHVRTVQSRIENRPKRDAAVHDVLDII
jgi:predicted RNase H-like nuclease